MTMENANLAKAWAEAGNAELAARFKIGLSGWDGCCGRGAWYDEDAWGCGEAQLWLLYYDLWL